MGAGGQRQHVGQADRGRASRTSRWPTSPARPRCWAAGSRPSTPRSTAGSWPTAPSPSTWPTWRPTASTPSTWWSSNLYPFSSDPSIELIDVGGPTMVRAAAKNHEHVGIVTSPDDYPARARRAARVRLAVRAPPAAGWPGPPSPTRRPTTPPSSPGSTPAAPRRWRTSTAPPRPTPRRPRSPPSCRRRCTSRSSAPRCCATARTRTSAARATASPAAPSWWDDMVQHGGNAAVVPQPLRRRRRLAAGPRAGGRRRPAGAGGVAIIKHANPCGAAVADDLVTAYERALECDVQSAFGGVVAIGGRRHRRGGRRRGRRPAGRRHHRVVLRRPRRWRS